MTLNELMIVNANSLPIEQRQFIDEQIGQMIQQHKNNRNEINRMTLDCVAGLTAGRSRSAEMANQGTLSRLWGRLTGKNQRMQDEINRNYAATQYASQMCLQKLAEQNLMTFELVATVNNKLNSFAVSISQELNNVNREINNIYDVMGKFFKQTRSDILQLEQRVDRLEQNVKLLNWKNSIEYQSYDGVEYESLSTVGKIVCMTKDFYEITQGKWTTSDLLLLKSALAEVDLPPKSKITYLDFLNGLIDEPKFLRRLLDGINLDNVDAVYTTILETVKKYQILEGDEKYLVDTISDFMREQRVSINIHKVKTGLVKNYIYNASLTSLNTEIPIYEFCLELIYNFEQIDINKTKINYPHSGTKEYKTDYGYVFKSSSY